MARNHDGTVRKILRLIKPYLHYLVLSLVFAVISVALTLYAPILTGNAIDYIIGTNQVDFDSIFYILKILACCHIHYECSAVADEPVQQYDYLPCCKG